MSTLAQAALRASPLERALRDFEMPGAPLPDDIVPRVARRRAAEQLRRLGWPQARDEQWRYTNLRALERIDSFAPTMAPADTDAALIGMPDRLPGFQRRVFVDGIHAPDASGHSISPDAGTAAALRLPTVAEPWTPGQRLALLNDMFAQDAAVLRIEGEAAIELLFISTARAGASYPRLLIELAPDSRLQLVERHLTLGGRADAPATLAAAPYLIGSVANIELGRASHLRHYRLQQYGSHALLADTLTARLHERARYEVHHLAMGAAGTRTSAHVRLIGVGASFGWQAIAIGQGEQVHDTTLAVEHAAAQTHTEELFRGIAEERSRLAFSGHIHVQSGAPGAEARQSLRGLIEGSGAEIDLRPRLQIDTDEVSAQHGATTGRLDEQLLFYLLTRGIDRRTARALLKWAFLGDVLRAIELPELRAQIEHSAAGQLRDVLAVGAVSTPPASAGAPA